MKLKRQRRFKSGFTMVELMAVLIILGLLATAVVMNFTGRVEKARVETTKANLKLLHNAILQFKMDTGQYPSEEDGLYALIEQPADVRNWQSGGYLETTDIPVDGWGNDFEYIRFPESGKPFAIKSYGADGEPGGEEETADEDLLSTDAN